jgi:uncharacterized protein YndB with AHSA1/START domain
MSEASFVYVTYIRGTPDQVWKGLLDAEFTRRYWAHENVSDWKPGSSWEHRRTDAAGTLDLVGEVVESTPPRRLVLTWAEPADKTNRAKHSRVAIELEPIEDMVRLTITHGEFEPGSEMRRKIGEGWPRVLASLKSLLETGRPLPTCAGRS